MMKYLWLVISFLLLTTSAFAQVSADTPVSDEQFLKSCNASAVSSDTPYCACLALEIEKAAKSERELLIGRQVVAAMDPAFGIPSYSGEDATIYGSIAMKVLDATGACGKAATLKQLNPDGTFK